MRTEEMSDVGVGSFADVSIGGKTYPAGSIVPTKALKLLKDDEIENLITAGHLVDARGGRTAPVPPGPREPKASKTPPPPVNLDRGVGRPAADPTQQGKSLRDFDPATLKDTPLTQLNGMVLEREGPDFKPFETVEEAISHLSSDFVVAGATS